MGSGNMRQPEEVAKVDFSLGAGEPRKKYAHRCVYLLTGAPPVPQKLTFVTFGVPALIPLF